MGDLFQRFLEFLDYTAIRLDEDVTFGQIFIFIGFLAVSLLIVEYIRRWLRRLFNRLQISENIEKRFLAILFLIVMIIAIGFAFKFAGIDTGGFGKFLDYDLTELFQSSQESVETETGQIPPPVIDNRDKSKLTIANLFFGFAIVFGMFILSKYAQWVLRRQVLQAFQIERHTQFIILRIFHFVLITIGVIISLKSLGMNLTSLAIIFGGLSIGIGFGLQNLVSNLISGFILIFERPIKIGDLVEVMDVDIFGRVSSINLRSTVIIAVDEKEIIVPNSQLITEPVHNLTHYNNRFRIKIKASVSFSSDPELVKQVLLEAAHAHPDVITEPTPEMENVTPPFVRFTNFGEFSLDFDLLAWIPNTFDRFDVASDLHFMIWEKFKEYDIQIPFPQQEVHLTKEKD
ncbi:MAG: mechanosensitive ion channel [Candidatus Poribacteria bacterium]|nr:mechanosensitive ion channel [Candidatus Poribacteria bacterium]